MGERRRARIFALQTLFQHEITKEAADDILSGFWSSRRIKEDTKAFTEKLVKGVIANMQYLDDIISKGSKRWKIGRIALIDSCIIRMAIFETRTFNTPKSVVINEAIEISKLYSSKKSAAFINGVLDKVIRESDAT